MKEYKPDGSSSWHGWQNNPVRARPPCPLRRVALSMRPTRPALVSHVRAVVGGGAVRLHLVRSRAAVLGYVPDSRGSVAHHQFGLGAPQSCTLRFPVQSPGKVHRLALPADNNLVVNHSSSARSLCGLFVPIIHARLPFVPFHAVLLGFLLSPTRPTLAHLPPVQHQHPQLGRRTLRLTLDGRAFQLFLGSAFGTGTQTPGQGVQR